MHVFDLSVLATLRITHVISKMFMVMFKYYRYMYMHTIMHCAILAYLYAAMQFT